MEKILQISIITGVLLFFGFIIILLRKNAFSLKYALLWLLTAIIMLVLCVFPSILEHIANTLGFEVASNALFTLLFGFIIAILLQQTSAVSRQAENNKVFIQTIALLEKRIRDLEKEKNGEHTNIEEML